MVDVEEMKEKIKKAEQTMTRKIIAIVSGAIVLFWVAYNISTSNYTENPSVILGLLTSISIGIGVGLTVLMYTTIINFTNTKKLIMIEAKLDEIAEKL